MNKDLEEVREPSREPSGTKKRKKCSREQQMQRLSVKSMASRLEEQPGSQCGCKEVSESNGAEVREVRE